MRFFVSLAAAVVLLAALVLAGCSGDGNNAQKGNAGAANARKDAGQPQHPDNVRRVTITELRDALDQGKAVVVDVRTAEAYNMEHIKGALLIPESQVAARASELPKDKLLVFYCS